MFRVADKVAGCQIVRTFFERCAANKHYCNKRQFSVYRHGNRKATINKHRKYSLIAGTTAALMSTFAVSNQKLGIWNVSTNASMVTNTTPHTDLSAKHDKRGKGMIGLMEFANKTEKKNFKQAWLESTKLNIPLFMPHCANIDDCSTIITHTTSSSSSSESPSSRIDTELEYKLQLIYNYGRQCSLLGKSDKEIMTRWLETEIAKHNNYNCNGSNNWNTFKLDRESVHLGSIDETGQRYLIYTVVNLTDRQSYQYIVIQGTRNWKNIQSQLKSELIFDDLFGMYLHKGYCDATHRILDDILQHINPNCQLRLTGHSYGGVLCTLLGYYLTHVNECDNHRHIASKSQERREGAILDGSDPVLYDIDQIVVFGMPEFADQHSCLNLVHNNENLPLLRVEHVNDYIARFDWNKYNQLKTAKFLPSMKNNSNRRIDTQDRNVAKSDTSDEHGNVVCYREFTETDHGHPKTNMFQNNEIFYVGANDSSNGGAGGTSDGNINMSVLLANGLKADFDLQKYLIGRPRCVHRMRHYIETIETEIINSSS